jgi:hypothetical protein
MKGPNPPVRRVFPLAVVWGGRTGHDGPRLDPTVSYDFTAYTAAIEPGAVLFGLPQLKHS